MLQWKYQNDILKNMKNKNISTLTGAVILVIIAITAGELVLTYEKQNDTIQTLNRIGSDAQVLSQNIMKNQRERLPAVVSEEFPMVQIQPGLSLEELIKQAFYKKYPHWESKNFNVAVTVETNQERHAIGRVVFDGGQHNNGELIWFAAESNNSWTLTNVSGVGYWGACQDFRKYSFPKDMTPDCWDTEKNILIDTSNPQRFYSDGFTKSDKQELIRAFISYKKTTHYDKNDVYLHKDLYVKITKNTKDYFEGAILIGGYENYSAPYFLAAKQNGKWVFVTSGQDDPSCDAIEPYDFPRDIVDKCYDEQTKQTKENL